MVPSKDQPLAQLHVRQRPRRQPGRWQPRIEQWRWRRVAIGDRVRHPRRPHTGHPRPQVAPRRVTVRCNLAMPGCVCDGVVAEAPVSDYDIDRGPEFDTSTPVSSLTLHLARCHRRRRPDHPDHGHHPVDSHPGDRLTAHRSPGTVERNPKEVDMSWIRRRIRRLRNLASGSDYSGAHQGGSGTTSEQHNRASFEAQSYRPDRTGGGGWGGSV